MLREPNKAKTDRSSSFLLNKFIIHLNDLPRGEKLACCDQSQYPIALLEQGKTTRCGSH